MGLFSQLQNSLAPRQAHNITLNLSDYACVALILRGASWTDLELGFIKRAIHPEDRWSGQLAFPGGRKEESDQDDFAAVLRETLEEVGLDLGAADLLGRLDDLQARRVDGTLEFFIRPFVFYIERDFTPHLDASEIADFFWFPFWELNQSQRQKKIYLQHQGQEVILPAIDVDQVPLLWGLSLSMTQDLLQTLAPKS